MPYFETWHCKYLGEVADSVFYEVGLGEWRGMGQKRDNVCFIPISPIIRLVKLAVCVT